MPSSPFCGNWERFKNLAEVGIGRGHLKDLAKRTLVDSMARTNPIPLVDINQVLEILDMATG